MRFVEVCLVFAIAVTAVLGCEPLPDGEECPPSGLHLYVDKDHCSKYWECYNGCATHMTCQLDYLYDEEHGWCNYPDKVFCGDRDCDGRPCADKPSNSTFDCPEEDGYYADPENCIKYYHCFEGIAERITCQKEGTQQLCYDPANVWCNWCSTVSCGDRPICDTDDNDCETQPEHTTTTRKPTNCDHIDCSHDGLHQEGDCEQCFCECANGFGYEICCDDDLVFNEDAGSCDWPENIPECKKKK